MHSAPVKGELERGSVFTLANCDSNHCKSLVHEKRSFTVPTSEIRCFSMIGSSSYQNKKVKGYMIPMFQVEMYRKTKQKRTRTSKTTPSNWLLRHYILVWKTFSRARSEEKYLRRRKANSLDKAPIDSPECIEYYQLEIHIDLHQTTLLLWLRATKERATFFKLTVKSTDEKQRVWKCKQGYIG